MITEEAVGYNMPLGKKNKRVEEQIEYRKGIKKCSLCEGEVDVKEGQFGEFGYIHRACKKDGDYNEYFFLVLCMDCFNAVDDVENLTAEQLRLKAVERAKEARDEPDKSG